jgi:hypothetical protein
MSYSRTGTTPVIREERLMRLARENGWIKPDGTLHVRLMARALRLHESGVARILDGRRPVTDSFVGRLLSFTGLPYGELFEDQDAPEELAS